MSTNRVGLGLVAVALFMGCATQAANPRFTLRYEKGLDQNDLASLMRRAGPGPVAVVDLGRTAWVSHHLVVVRQAEVPHYHRFHDLTVTVLRGEGVIEIEGRRYALKAGDVVHVQRGARHFFRNTGKQPSAAFVVFSPPFDNRDTVTAEIPAAEPTPEPETKGWWPFSKRRAAESKAESAKPEAKGDGSAGSEKTTDEPASSESP